MNGGVGNLVNFRYIKKGLFVEVGRSEISPSFDSILELLLAEGEYLAFAPDTEETHLMLNLMSSRYPLLEVVFVNHHRYGNGSLIVCVHTLMVFMGLSFSEFVGLVILIFCCNGVVLELCFCAQTF